MAKRSLVAIERDIGVKKKQLEKELVNLEKAKQKVEKQEEALNLLIEEKENFEKDSLADLVSNLGLTISEAKKLLEITSNQKDKYLKTEKQKE